MIRVYSRFAPVLLALLALLPVSASAQATSAATTAPAPLLLRFPSLSQDKIAFRYADDIWTVAATAARRSGSPPTAMLQRARSSRPTAPGLPTQPT